MNIEQYLQATRILQETFHHIEDETHEYSLEWIKKVARFEDKGETNNE